MLKCFRYSIDSPVDDYKHLTYIIFAETKDQAIEQLKTQSVEFCWVVKNLPILPQNLSEISIESGITLVSEGYNYST